MFYNWVFTFHGLRVFVNSITKYSMVVLQQRPTGEWNYIKHVKTSNLPHTHTSFLRFIPVLVVAHFWVNSACLSWMVFRSDWAPPRRFRNSGATGIHPWDSDNVVFFNLCSTDSILTSKSLAVSLRVWADLVRFANWDVPEFEVL